jgi:hypothetical protein
MVTTFSKVVVVWGKAVVGAGSSEKKQSTVYGWISIKR